MARPRSALTTLRVPLALGLLWLLVAVPYARSFGVPFIFDDLTIINNNQFMRSLWPIGTAMEAPRRSTAAGRPLVAYSFAVNYAVSGMEVWSYHVFNLLVHLTNATLVWFIVRGCLRRAKIPGIPTRLAGPIGWGFALLWGVHALNSETVIYIAQRTESMFALFSLAAFALLLANTRKEAGAPAEAGPDTARCPPVVQLGVLILIVFAVLCKESAVVMPPLLLLFDRAFVAGSFAAAWRRRRWLYVAMLLPIAVGVMIGRGGHRGGLVTGDPSVTWRYLLTQADVILLYLRLSVVPYPLAVTHDRDLFGGLADCLPQSVAVLGLVLATAYALWRHPRVGFLGAWFFFILAPTSSVIPIMSEVVAERRMYLPLLAVLALLGLGGWRLAVGAASWGRRPARLAVWRGRFAGAAACAAVAWGTMTYVRSLDFRSDLTLWAQTVRVEPGSLMARQNYAAALISARRLDEAEALVRGVLREQPDYPRAHMALGTIHFHREQWDRAADAYLTEAMKPDGKGVDYAHAAVALMMQDKHKEAEAAIQRALRLNPQDRQTLNFAAVILDRQGRLEDAEAAYRHLLTLYPESAMGRANFAKTLERLGRTDEAERNYREAYELFPDNYDITNNYANFLAKHERYAEAAPLFLEAAGLFPTRPLPRLKHAVCLARLDDPAAQAAFDDALILHPDHLPLYSRYLDWLIERERLGTALSVVKRGLQFFPDAPEMLERRQTIDATLAEKAGTS
ncbi:MAG: tetratricopeptide repeat protein [Planctomycetota bacterium]